MEALMQKVQAAIAAAASNLLSWAAGAEQSVHTLESNHPMVASAIKLAEQNPDVQAGLASAKSVLTFAQAVASAAGEALQPTGTGQTN